MNWYYCCKDGKTVVGPLPGEAINALHRCGTLTDDSRVVAEGSSDWKTFGETFKVGSSGDRTDVPDKSRTGLDQGTTASPIALMGAIRSIDFAALLQWVGSHKKVLVVGLLLTWVVGAKVHSKIERERAAREYRQNAAQRQQASRILTFTAHSCGRCAGTGMVKNTFVPSRYSEWSNPDGCRSCNGEGTILTRSGHSAVCQDCGGRGVNPTRRCDDCGGTGRVAR